VRSAHSMPLDTSPLPSSLRRRQLRKVLPLPTPNQALELEPLAAAGSQSWFLPIRAPAPEAQVDPRELASPAFPPAKATKMLRCMRKPLAEWADMWTSLCMPDSLQTAPFLVAVLAVVPPDDAHPHCALYPLSM
jgi:hypothetical protein